MARPLVIGNGRLLVCYDHRLILRDLYWPRVGQVNQIEGRHTQIGFWADDAFAWLGEAGWDRRLGYRRSSLVAESTAANAQLGLEVTLRDAVHPNRDILLRRIRVQNRYERPRELRLFAAHDFNIDETDIGDTAMWEPNLEAMIHYKRRRWFLCGGTGPDGAIAQYATGRKRFQGAEGTWRDAEDGRLEMNPISQGAVDSVIGLTATLGPRATADFYLWIVCGTDHQAVKAGQDLIRSEGPAALIAQTDGYWQAWVEASANRRRSLPKELQEACARSLLIIRTQVDDGGAVLAANDSDILETNRDHYSYMWPRDGAFVAATLDRAGYAAVARRFFEFCRGAVSAEGFFWHKYNPDGSLGSSWHPWVGCKGLQLPIQEDETALVLWAVGCHYRLHREQEFLSQAYASLVRPAADFLVQYRDEKTHLPLESYDLWEERRGVFTFTVAAVVAGLVAAADMARGVGDTARAERYSRAAEETRGALVRYLWSEERQHFIRGIYMRCEEAPTPDVTLESSVMAVFLLGVLPASDPRVEATARALEAGLRAPTEVGGIARYAGDYYFRQTDEAPGNPWIICSLWLARWYIARARTRQELQPALDWVQWALAAGAETGALPEQVHPLTGEPLSVMPLTWSHATLVDTLLDLNDKLRQLG